MDRTAADNLLKSLIGAYVWVASADAEVDLLEYHKFGHVIVQSPFATQFEENHIRSYFKDTVTLFEKDYDRAVLIIQDELRELADKEQFRQEVMRISRAACVGDGKLIDGEEAVLREIAKTISFEGEI